MKTHTPTPAEMAERMARFARLDPYSVQQEANADIPVGAMESVAAKWVYPIMVPADYDGRADQAPVKAGNHVVLTIAECPPGNGPALHNHETTTENFFCLEGRFRIRWGDEGEHEVFLDPHDFISVPPGVMRDFCNVADELGRLLVVIETSAEAATDNVAFAPVVGEQVAREYGAAAVTNMEAKGLKFDAGVAE